MTRCWAASDELYLGVLHVENVSVILRDVALDAGQVSTLLQPGKVGPEGLTSNIESKEHIICSNLTMRTERETLHLSGRRPQRPAWQTRAARTPGCARTSSQTTEGRNTQNILGNHSSVLAYYFISSNLQMSGCEVLVVTVFPMTPLSRSEVLK